MTKYEEKFEIKLRQSKDGEQFAGGQITSPPSAPGGGLTGQRVQHKVWSHCPVAEQIRKEAMGKVLDKLATWLLNNEFAILPKATVWDKIKELRQGKDGD